MNDIRNPARLDRDLLAIPGVVGTGLFIGMANTVLVAGSPGKITVRESLAMSSATAIQGSEAAARSDLQRLYRAAIDAVDPQKLIARALGRRVRRCRAKFPV